MSKKVDLSGKLFGRLLVLKEEPIRDAHGNVVWRCSCICGNIKNIRGSDLKTGAIKSCGCLHRQRISEDAVIDLTGLRFERWEVLEYAYTKNRKVYWKCSCECGNIRIVYGANLVGGKSKSCGCLQRKLASEAHRGRTDVSGKDNPNYRHGLKGTREYNNAKNAKRRARKLDQTPSVVNLQLIQTYYNTAATMEGIEVDHIKPLSKGGLHHEDNLQLLDKKLNREKFNKWPLTDEEQIKYKGIKL